MPAAHGVRDDERHMPVLAREQPLGHRLAFADPFDRLPRAAAGGEHATLVVEHDDRLAALLDQHAGSLGVDVHLAACSRTVTVLRHVLHHLVTASQPVGGPP